MDSSRIDRAWARNATILFAVAHVGCVVAPEFDWTLAADAGGDAARPPVDATRDAARVDADPACVDELGNAHEIYEFSGADGRDNDCDRRVDETGAVLWDQPLGELFAVEAGAALVCRTSSVGRSTLYVSIGRVRDNVRDGMVLAFAVDGERPVLQWRADCDARAAPLPDGSEYRDRWRRATFGGETFPLVVTEQGDLITGCRVEGTRTELRRYAAEGDGRPMWTLDLREQDDLRGAMPPAAYLPGVVVVRSGTFPNRYYAVDAESGWLLGGRSGQSRPADQMLAPPIAHRAGRVFHFYTVRVTDADRERPVDPLAELLTVSAADGAVVEWTDLGSRAVAMGPFHPLMHDGERAFVFAGGAPDGEVTTLLRVLVSDDRVEQCDFPGSPLVGGPEGIVTRLAGTQSLALCPWACDAGDCAPLELTSQALASWQGAWLLEGGRLLAANEGELSSCHLASGRCESVRPALRTAQGGNHIVVGLDGVVYYCVGDVTGETSVGAWRLAESGVVAEGWGAVHHDERATRAR